MTEVIGVRFKKVGKVYYFDPCGTKVKDDQPVIVETARGIEFGEVVTPVREMNDEQLTAPLKQVVRIATAQDVQHAQENKQNEKEAYAICQKKIADHGLHLSCFRTIALRHSVDHDSIHSERGDVESKSGQKI